MKKEIVRTVSQIIISTAHLILSVYLLLVVLGFIQIPSEAATVRTIEVIALLNFILIARTQNWYKNW